MRGLRMDVLDLEALDAALVILEMSRREDWPERM
jgi:hypothetical protein